MSSMGVDHSLDVRNDSTSIPDLCVSPSFVGRMSLHSCRLVVFLVCMYARCVFPCFPQGVPPSQLFGRCSPHEARPLPDRHIHTNEVADPDVEGQALVFEHAAMQVGHSAAALPRHRPGGRRGVRLSCRVGEVPPPASGRAFDLRMALGCPEVTGRILDLVACPELAMRLLLYALAPTDCRQVEGIHAVLRKAKLSRFGARAPFFSMVLRRSELERWLDDGSMIHWVSALWARKSPFRGTLRFVFPSKADLQIRLMSKIASRALWYQIEVARQSGLMQASRRSLAKWRGHAAPSGKPEVGRFEPADVHLVSFVQHCFEKCGWDQVWSLPGAVFDHAVVGSSSVSGGDWLVWGGVRVCSGFSQNEAGATLGVCS